MFRGFSCVVEYCIVSSKQHNNMEKTLTQPWIVQVQDVVHHNLNVIRIDFVVAVTHYAVVAFCIYIITTGSQEDALEN